MANYTYTFKGYDKETMAKAVGMDMPISLKATIEVCNYIRKKNLQTAKTILRGVIQKKKPIPYKRFTGGAGHKPGIGPGKYPVKVSQHILTVLENAEANAQQKGLNASTLIITHINSHKASTQPHYGRQRGRNFKRTHVEVILTEGEGKKKMQKEAKTEEKKSAKQEMPKQIEKKQEKPIQPKPETHPKIQEKNLLKSKPNRKRR